MSENASQELISKLVGDIDQETWAAMLAERSRQDAVRAEKSKSLQDDLMAEYRQLIKGVPAGAYGNDQRFKAKLKIRQRAAAMGVESPV